MNERISRLFDDFEEELELPEIEMDFDVSRIKHLVHDQINSSAKKRRPIKPLRTILIAAAVMCMLVTSVYGVGKLLEISYPDKDEVFAIEPITITGYNGEYVTEVVGYRTYKNVEFVMRYDVSSDDATLLAYRTNWLPEGTEYLWQANYSDLYNANYVYTPNTLYASLSSKYFKNGYFNSETREYEVPWYNQWKYEWALKRSGLSEEESKNWLTGEQYASPEGNFNIDVLERSVLYDRDLIVYNYADVEVFEESETDEWITVCFSAHQTVGDVELTSNYFTKFHKEEKYLVVICGYLGFEAMENIFENMEILDTKIPLDPYEGHLDDQWRYAYIGYSIG